MYEAKNVLNLTPTLPPTAWLASRGCPRPLSSYQAQKDCQFPAEEQVRGPTGWKMTALCGMGAIETKRASSVTSPTSWDRHHWIGAKVR